MCVSNAFDDGNLANGARHDRACSVISLWIAIAIGFSGGVRDIFVLSGEPFGFSMYGGLCLRLGYSERLYNIIPSAPVQILVCLST